MDAIRKIYIISCWSFFVLLLLTYPFPSSSSSEMSLIHADKAVHFFLFSVLSFLIVNYFAENRNYKLVFSTAAATCSFYVLILEAAQIYIPGRAYAEGDVFAGLAGVGAGLIIFFYYKFDRKKAGKSILLHICCAGCGAYTTRLLQKDHNVTLFYYNPNIYPEKELKKRTKEARRIAKKFKVPIIVPKQDHQSWLNKVKDHKDSPEGGERCYLCYLDRLEETARKAKTNKFDLFSTTMTISPHKDAEKINNIGKKLEKEYEVEFLVKDFKKQDGFKKSVQLSKQLELYRQNYCGCEFSVK
ncbi:MAG: epoxyqueuosine reductase QueH [Patescibacteria group bacterium]